MLIRSRALSLSTLLPAGTSSPVFCSLKLHSSSVTHPTNSGSLVAPFAETPPLVSWAQKVDTYKQGTVNVDEDRAARDGSGAAGVRRCLFGVAVNGQGWSGRGFALVLGAFIFLLFFSLSLCYTVS